MLQSILTHQPPYIYLYTYIHMQGLTEQLIIDIIHCLYCIPLMLMLISCAHMLICNKRMQLIIAHSTSTYIHVVSSTSFLAHPHIYARHIHILIQQLSDDGTRVRAVTREHGTVHCSIIIIHYQRCFARHYCTCTCAHTI